MKEGGHGCVLGDFNEIIFYYEKQGGVVKREGGNKRGCFGNVLKSVVL